MKNERALAYFAFATVCVIWGTTYLAIRIAIETLPTFLFAGVRFSIAGAVLLLLCAASGQPIPRRRGDWVNAGIIGLLMVGVANVAVIWAEHHMSSGMAALLVATSPLWMVMLEKMRDPSTSLSLPTRVGMLVGFSGVALLVWPEVAGSSFNLMFFLGFVGMQLGSIAWNYGSIRSKYQPIDASPLVSAAMQMLTGGGAVLLLGVFKGESSSFHFSARTLAAFLYLVVFGSIIAYGAYVYALSKLPTATVSLYAYINPVVAVLLGRMILGEPLTWSSLIAMLVIFTGIGMVQREKRAATLAAEAGSELIAATGSSARENKVVETHRRTA